MTPIEFRARREALGLSQVECARLLDVAQATISRWEHGQSRIPDGIDLDLGDAEDFVSRLTHHAVRTVETVNEPDPVLFVWPDDHTYWAAHPESDGMPAVLHRVAMARAAVTVAASLATPPD